MVHEEYSDPATPEREGGTFLHKIGKILGNTCRIGKEGDKFGGIRVILFGKHCLYL